MSKIDSRPLRKSFITACVGIMTLAGHAQGQAISISPAGLREGDGNSGNVTLGASVTPGASLSVSVNYSSDPTRPAVSFIPKFVIQDNAAEDRDRQEGRIPFGARRKRLTRRAYTSFTLMKPNRLSGSCMNLTISLISDNLQIGL